MAKIGDLAVYVADGEHSAWLLPGDDVPTWAAHLVGKHALAHAEHHHKAADPDPEPGSQPTPRRPRKAVAGE